MTSRDPPPPIPDPGAMPGTRLLVLTASTWAHLPHHFRSCLDQLRDFKRLYVHLLPGSSESGWPLAKMPTASLDQKIRTVKKIYGLGARRPELDIRVLLNHVKSDTPILPQGLDKIPEKIYIVPPNDDLVQGIVMSH